MFYRYASISIGNPPQKIEMDLNMLVSDFYVVTTSSRVGTRFDEFFSQSYGERAQSDTGCKRQTADILFVLVHSNKHPYPMCRLPTDDFHFPTIGKAIPLDFTHCRPSKSSLKTLAASGSMLGLAPSEHLR